MIPTYTTPVGLPKICLAFDWPTQMKIPRTAPAPSTTWATWMRTLLVFTGRMTELFTLVVDRVTGE